MSIPTRSDPRHYFNITGPYTEIYNRGKIVELLSEYNLGRGYGEKLEQKWTHPDPESRKSMRELAVKLNTEIISQFIKQRADRMIPIHTSPEKIQTILRDISTNDFVAEIVGES